MEIIIGRSPRKLTKIDENCNLNSVIKVVWELHITETQESSLRLCIYSCPHCEQRKMNNSTLQEVCETEGLVGTRG